MLMVPTLLSALICSFALSLTPPPPAQAAKARLEAKARIQKELAAVEELLAAGKRYAALERMQKQPSRTQVAQLYDAACVWFLQKKKDVDAFVWLSEAGIQYGLTVAPFCKNPKEALYLRSVSKMLAYNLAANVWQGWGVGVFPASKIQQRLGLDAARLNLRLAKELHKPKIKVAHAHWMLGATLIGLGKHADAATAFRDASRFASTEDKVFQLSAEGFLGVTWILAGREKEGRQRMEKSRAALLKKAKAGDKDAGFYAAQFAHALNAFGS